MRFDYQRPASLSEAVDLLADAERSRRPLAYGSDLLVWAKSAADRPEAVVDISGLEELRRLETGETHLFIGSGVTIGELTRAAVVADRFPALARATWTMGSIQLREGASIGGNICTASPAGDTGPPLLCYDAVMVAASTAGEREIPSAEFFLGPGQTALSPGEILLGLRLPWPPEGGRGTYLKGARRAAVDLALVSVAATAWPSSVSSSGVELRMALGAVAPTPVRASRAESLAAAHGLDASPESERGRALAEAAREAARPIDDVRASAEYRLELVGQLAARAAAELARGPGLSDQEPMENRR